MKTTSLTLVCLSFLLTDTTKASAHGASESKTQTKFEYLVKTSPMLSRIFIDNMAFDKVVEDPRETCTGNIYYLQRDDYALRCTDCLPGNPDYPASCEFSYREGNIEPMTYVQTLELGNMEAEHR